MLCQFGYILHELDAIDTRKKESTFTTKYFSFFIVVVFLSSTILLLPYNDEKDLLLLIWCLRLIYSTRERNKLYSDQVNSSLSNWVSQEKGELKGKKKKTTTKEPRIYTYCLSWLRYYYYNTCVLANRVMMEGKNIILYFWFFSVLLLLLLPFYRDRRLLSHNISEINRRLSNDQIMLNWYFLSFLIFIDGKRERERDSLQEIEE